MTAERILVVDDEPDISLVLSVTLRRAGYRVTTARDGVEALEKLAATTPDLVLLDVMMPRMDGLETLRRIRASAATAHVPVIMLTAKAQVADRLAGFDRGADDYVPKPFETPELVARVQSLLRRSAEARMTSPLLGLLGSWSSSEGIAQFGRDLEAARDIQARLIPEVPPTLAGLGAAGVLHPSSVVGGDFFDVFPIGGRIGIVVGDVSGKGISAALVMVMVRTLLREIASTLTDPTAILSRLNAALCRDMPPAMFVTLALGVVDPQRPGHVVVAGAGHPEPVLARADGTTAVVAARGSLLGAFAEATFEVAEIDLEEGAMLALYTDGVVELPGERDQGTALHALLASRTGQPAAVVAHAVADDVLARAGDRLRDDVTVFVLARAASAAA